jgi:hypothetical protein
MCQLKSRFSQVDSTEDLYPIPLNFIDDDDLLTVNNNNDLLAINNNNVMFDVVINDNVEHPFAPFSIDYDNVMEDVYNYDNSSDDDNGGDDGEVENGNNVDNEVYHGIFPFSDLDLFVLWMVNLYIWCEICDFRICFLMVKVN